MRHLVCARPARRERVQRCVEPEKETIVMQGKSVHEASVERQRGVTLIEILVAMVLLAVGLLGLAGLQLRGMQVNQGSIWRSQAAVMAEDLADRMRADPVDAQQFSSTSVFYGTFTPSATSTFAPISDWQTILGMMPGGSVPVTTASGATVTDATGQTLPASCNGILPCAVVGPAVGPAPTAVPIAIYWNDSRAATGALGAGAAQQIGSFRMYAELGDF
jgi:type IV pilus assembly protein PilV